MIDLIKKDDIPSCLSIYNYYIKNSTATFEITPLSLEQFEKRVNKITSKFPFIVYKNNNDVLGYAYLDYFIEREAADITADLSIYICKDCRGLGIGTKLLKEIIKLAPNYKIKNIISVVTTNNISSIRFHEQNKFSKEGIINNIAYKLGEKLGVIYYKLEL